MLFRNELQFLKVSSTYMYFNISMSQLLKALWAHGHKLILSWWTWIRIFMSASEHVDYNSQLLFFGGTNATGSLFVALLSYSSRSNIWIWCCRCWCSSHWAMMGAIRQEDEGCYLAHSILLKDRSIISKTVSWSVALWLTFANKHSCHSLHTFRLRRTNVK